MTDRRRFLHITRGQGPGLKRMCESRIFGRPRSAGAKARIFFSFGTARLKSCPDTKPQSGDARKARLFPRIWIYPFPLRRRSSRLSLAALSLDLGSHTDSKGRLIECDSFRDAPLLKQGAPTAS
jgi:hypothetical protein